MVSPCPRQFVPAEVVLALVSNPFTLLYSFGPSTQRHEVALDYVLGILWVQPCGQRLRKMVGIYDVVAAGNGTTRFVHANGLCERG